MRKISHFMRRKLSISEGFLSHSDDEEFNPSNKEKDSQ